jgi:hypothetical protein
MRITNLPVLICAALVFSGTGLQAQQLISSLHGVLSDSSGAVIPAATVIANGNGAQRTTVTQADGSYTLALGAGEYKISVAFPGFNNFERSVTIEPGVTAQLPIQLIPGGGKQEVTVTADAQSEITIDPGQNASAVVIKDSDLDALPDDPGDLADMLTAMAGPTAGANGDAGSLIVDGFAGGQLPAKNTIKEVRINQNPFSAEYEYLGFGRIEIITKPGTDTLHGNIQFTDSDAYFNSRNPYAANKAPYVNRTFNETLSNSFLHKGSWTLNATQNRIDNDAIIHAVTLDPNTLASVAVDQSVVTPRNNLAGTGRFDYQISANHTMMARYSYNRNDRDNAGIGSYSLLSRAYSSEGSSHELQATETAVINTHLVTETRFLYSRSENRQYGDISTPAINVDGSFNGGANQVGNQFNKYRRYDAQNISTYIHGTHTLRFGVRWILASVTDSSPANFGGTFSFQGVGNAPALDADNQPIPGSSISISSLEQYRRTLLFQKLGYSSAAIRSLGGGASLFSIAGGNPLASVEQTQFEAFMQDDWRIKPNITLSVGLRHEQQTEIHHYPFPIAPRVSLSWSPGSTAGKPGKTVIRLGAGIFFDRFGTNLALQSARFNGTTQQQYLVTNPSFFSVIPSLDTLAALKQPPVTWRISPDMKPDVDTMEAVTLERQLPRKSTFTATYLHIRGDHFPIIVNINTPLPGTYNPANPSSGVRPYGDAAGNMFEYQSNGIYRQRLFIVKWESKFNKTVSLTTNYTLGFSKHDGNWLATPSNPYNFMADYGRAGYDRRHQVNLVGTVQLPLHLQFNPMLVLSSGAPYDLTIGHDLNGDSFGSDRPAFATDMTRPSVVITRFGAFDTNPMPGQTIVPHNYLMGDGMWNINARLGRTFSFGKAPASSGQSSGAEKRFKLNFNIDVNNVCNHLNPGGYVGNLSSPLFGQSTSVNLFRETSNLRRVQFGTSLTF